MLYIETNAFPTKLVDQSIIKLNSPNALERFLIDYGMIILCIFFGVACIISAICFAIFLPVENEFDGVTRTFNIQDNFYIIFITFLSLLVVFLVLATILLICIRNAERNNILYVDPKSYINYYHNNVMQSLKSINDILNLKSLDNYKKE